MNAINLPDTINLSNANEVLALLKSLRFSNNETPQSLDVSHVKRCDSSGISVLIEAQAYFKKQGVDLKFSYPSEQIKQMSLLFKIENLLFKV